MNQFIEKIREATRWDNIPGDEEGFRLLCSNPICSLSCGNLKNGRLSVTSIHGTERHSYSFTKKDMVFTTLMFLQSLPKEDLKNFCKIFNHISPEIQLGLKKFK